MTPRNFATVTLWILALVLASWALKQLPLADIAAQLERLSWHNWLFWLLINCAILYLAVKRWQVLGRALQTPLTLTSLFRLRQAGSAVSFLTPGPHFGGEPLQLYWMHRHCGIILHRAVAMLGLDRFVETGTNFAVLLAGVLILLGTALLPVHEWLQVCATLAGVLGAMLMAAALVLRHPQWLAKRWQSNNAGGWRALVDLLQAALAKHQPHLWLALLLSIVGWGALLLELVVLMRFLGLSPSPTELILVMVGMRLAMLLPVPGGIGTIEASLLWSFQLLGLPVTVAVGLIALMRLRDALVLFIGLACLWSFHRLQLGSAPALAK